MQILKPVIKEGMELSIQIIINYFKCYLDGRKIKDLSIKQLEDIAEEIGRTNFMEEETAISYFKLARTTETGRKSTRRYNSKIKYEISYLKAERERLVREIKLPICYRKSLLY